jgi:hypothetical protein
MCFVLLGLFVLLLGGDVVYRGGGGSVPFTQLSMNERTCSDSILRAVTVKQHNPILHVLIMEQMKVQIQ